jgi:hypothetical protein
MTVKTMTFSSKLKSLLRVSFGMISLFLLKKIPVPQIAGPRGELILHINHLLVKQERCQLFWSPQSLSI